MNCAIDLFGATDSVLLDRLRQKFPLHCAIVGLGKKSDSRNVDPALFAGGPGSGPHPGMVKNAIEDIHSRFPQNPDKPEERMLLVGGKKVGGFQVAEREGGLRIKTIHSDDPGSGVGGL